MTTLFIDRKNSALSIDQDALIFSDHDTGGKIATVPIKLLERVCIHGELYLSASVLGKLGKQGVGVLVLSLHQSG